MTLVLIVLATVIATSAISSTVFAIWRGRESGTSSLKEVVNSMHWVVGYIPTSAAEDLQEILQPYNRLEVARDAAFDGQVQALQQKIFDAQEELNHDKVQELQRNLADLLQQQQDANAQVFGKQVAVSAMFFLSIIIAPALYWVGYGLKYDVVSEMISSPFTLVIMGMRINPLAASIAMGMVLIDVVLGLFLAWTVDLWKDGKKGGAIVLGLIVGAAVIALIAIEGYLGVYRGQLQEMITGQESPVAWHVMMSMLIPFVTILDSVAIKVILPSVAGVLKRLVQIVWGVTLLSVQAFFDVVKFLCILVVMLGVIVSLILLAGIEVLIYVTKAIWGFGYRMATKMGDGISSWNERRLQKNAAQMELRRLEAEARIKEAEARIEEAEAVGSQLRETNASSQGGTLPDAPTVQVEKP